MVCKPVGHHTWLAISIIFSMLVLFITLSVFFTFIISKSNRSFIEENVQGPLKTRILEGVKRSCATTGGTGATTGGTTGKTVLTILGKIYSRPKLDNKWLHIIMITGGIFLLLLFVAVYTFLRISCGYCHGIWDILIEHLIILGSVGVIIKYIFFTKIVKYYTPISSDVITTNIINDLKAKIHLP